MVKFSIILKTPKKILDRKISITEFKLHILLDYYADLIFEFGR